jgi:hypothetical protein
MKRLLKRAISDWKDLQRNKTIPKERSRFLLFADYIYYVFKTHITYSEYFEQYKFYTLSKAERKEYITVSEAHRIEAKLNQKVRDIFWKKDLFLTKFADFIKRDWISLASCTPEEFMRFCLAHPKFIVKPIAETRGTGVELIETPQPGDAVKVYNEFAGKNFIAEQYIIACKEFAEFNPDSLNTIRVVTYLNGDVFRIVGSFIRMGLPGFRVDNAHAGGIFAYVDVETGTVASEGINTHGDRYEFHPGSKKRIPGFQIPGWKNVTDTCKRAASIIPEAKIIGWDVAIRNDYEVIIIEGNHMPDFDLMQSPSRKGIKKKFYDIIEVEK